MRAVLDILKYDMRTNLEVLRIYPVIFEYLNVQVFFLSVSESFHSALSCWTILTYLLASLPLNDHQLNTFATFLNIQFQSIFS